MNFSDTLKRSVGLHPGLYRGTPQQQENRFLHHVFFVNGNGYEWVNGELVCEDNYTGPLTLEQGYEELWREHIASSHGNPGVSKDEYLGRTDDREKIYPLCQYTDILHTPTDVTPDWLDAAVRAINYALELKRTHEDNNWLGLAMMRVATILEQRGLPHTQMLKWAIGFTSISFVRVEKPHDRTIDECARWHGIGGLA